MNGLNLSSYNSVTYLSKNPRIRSSVSGELWGRYKRPYQMCRGLMSLIWGLREVSSLLDVC